MLVYEKSFWGYRGGKARHRRQLPRTSGFPVGNQTPRCAGFHPFHLPLTKPQTTSGNRLDNRFAEPSAQEGLIASRPVAGTQHSWETWLTAGGRGAPPKSTLSGTCCPVPSTLTVNYKHTEPPRSSSSTSQPFHALPGGQKLYTRERKFIFKTRSRLTFHQRCQ